MQEALEPCERDVLAVFFAEICVQAGALIMEVAADPDAIVRQKRDSSPVTDADERAEAFLLAAIARRLPSARIVAEESAARGAAPTAGGGPLILVDPLDGTREFIAGRPEFTVNVALVEGDAPSVGAVYAPALGRVWFAGAEAYVATAAPGASLPARESWRKLQTRLWPEAGVVALASLSHLDPQTEAFLARLNVKERIQAGSSLKFCRLAEGVADIYPRFGPTMEWDTAAGDAVLRAAGGAVLSPDGVTLRYGKAAENFRNGPFVAFGDPRAAREVLSSNVANGQSAPI